MIKNIMKNIGPKPAGVKAELLNALKNHKKTPGYNYSDFNEKDIDDFLEVAKTDMPNASPDELKNELISRYENAAKLTAREDILPSKISTDDFSYKQLEDYASGLEEALKTQKDKFTDETRAGTEKELEAVRKALLKRQAEKKPE